MGSPASLLDLIARGGPSYLGAEHNATMAGVASSQAQAEHAKALTQQTQEATRTQVQATEAERLKNQAAQVALQQQSILKDAYINTDRTPKQIEQYLLKNGATVSTIQGQRQHDAEIRQKVAIASKDEHENEGWIQQQTALALKAAQDDPANWAAITAPRLRELHPGQQFPDQPPDAKYLPGLVALNDYHGKVLATRKTEADITHAGAQTDEAKARTQKEIDDNARAAALQPSAISKAEADAKLATLKASGQEPIQPEAQAKIAEEHRQNVAREQNAARLADVAYGNLGVAKEHADIAAKVYEQTYGAGANPALVGVEPKMRAAAAAEAQKASNEYTKAMESTANLQGILDLAKGGNKVAYAYAPTTGVLTFNTANGVKRVNMAEIKSYGGAGSALDAVEKFLGKQATGASIPDELLKNMGEINKAVANSALSAYERRRESVNTNYHANFPSVAKGKGSTMIRARDPQGALHEAPAGTPLPAGWKEEK